MPRKSLGLALIFIISLSGCLEPSRVAALQPKPEGQSPSNSATLSLPRTALADLSITAQQLVIHVNKVEAGAVGLEVHDAYKFSLTDTGLYALDGLPLGELLFAISLLDANGQSLAEGSVQAVINLGPQTLPQIVLKPTQPTSVNLDLQLALNLINFPNTAPAVPAEPAAVRAVLKNYSCQSCHNNTAKAKAGLNLKDYPYKNTENETLPQLLTLVLDSLTGSNEAPIMPPSDVATVKPEEIAAVKDFLQTVNDASKASSDTWIKEVKISLSLGGPGRLESLLTLKDGRYVLADRISLLAGSRSTYSLTVMGPNGSKLYEVVDAVLDVPLDGKVLKNIDITYTAPSVTLPVTVQPSLN